MRYQSTEERGCAVFYLFVCVCVCVSEVSLSLNCDSMKFVGNNFLELYWDQIFSIKHYFCMYKGEYRVCVF